MKTKYTTVAENNQLIAERSFATPKERVWEYYTTAKLLDKWWAPAPYKCITKSFDFSPGGSWHYTMKGPEGDAHNCINNYQDIDPMNSFTALDAFADADWNIDPNMPATNWEVTFTKEGDMTDIKVVLTCQSQADLETLTNMGMKEGFDQGLNQLEELLVQ